MQGGTPSTLRQIEPPEVRHATFVMGDIVGSTRLANELDLDDQRAIASAFRLLVLKLAQRHAGFVMRFEGDGAFVAFGYPLPSEDAAESAVRYGLDLAAAVGGIDAVPGVRIAVRVGIASGLAAVGGLADHAANLEEAVEGPVPAMAERLKSVAAPGEVVIGDVTRRLAGQFFEYADLGAIAAKGFDAGLHAWKVVRASAVESRFEARRFQMVAGKIVGRDAQIEKLALAWRQAQAGAGAALALVGDAGLGKSRLARTALTLARADRATVLEVNCTPSTGNSPLYPIGELLRRSAQIAPQQSDEERRSRAQALLDGVVGSAAAPEVLAYLAPLFGIAAMPLPGHPTPGEVQAHTAASVVRIVRALAAQGPLALLCEDLHWADASTLGVLQQLAGEIAALPALLLVTSRTLADVALDWQRFVQIELQPLQQADAVRLVEAIAPGAALAPGLVSDIVERGEGVPLYLEEITRNLLEAVHGGEPQALAAVPATLQLTVQARLGRWPQLKPIVQAASVLGRDFPVAVLEHMLPERSGEVAATLSLLAEHGLFARADAPDAKRAHFKHALIRDTVYQTLLRGDRQRLHSSAADVLAGGDFAAQQTSPEVLAHHLFEARRIGEAIQVQLGAAAKAAERGAFVESQGYCDAALRWVDQVASPAERHALQFSLLVQRAIALSGRHGFAAAEGGQAYEAAYALCTEDVPAQLRYPVIRGLAGWNLVRGRLAAAHDFSLQGMQLAEQCGEAAFRIDALSMRVYTEMYYGRLDHCRSLIDRFLVLYRQADGARLRYPSPQDACTSVLSVLPTVAWLLGDSSACEQAIADGLEHVERLGRPFDQAMLHSWTAGTRYTQHRYADALRFAMRTVEIAAPAGYRDWLAGGALLASMAQAAMQPSAQAVAQASQLCMAFAAEGVGLNAPYYACGLARGLIGLQRWTEAEAVLADAKAYAAGSGEHRMDADLLMLKAQLPGWRANAAQLLRQALDIAEAQGALATALRVAAHLLLLTTADGTAAERAREALAILDGQASAPLTDGWMAAQYADIKQGLAAGAA